MISKIVVHNIDDTGEDADFLYCAIVMLYGSKGWYNSGIVVREKTPEKAFTNALNMAKKTYWK